MVDGPILIVGCGIFGLSTALELVRNGYFVHIIDKYEPPSPWSASTDFNKIIRCEYNDPMYMKMAVEALHMWRSDPIFKKSLSECGRILVTPLSHKGRRNFELKGIKNMQKVNEGTKIEFYAGGKELSEKFEAFRNNMISDNQEVKFNPESGLGRSSQSLTDIYTFLSKHPNVKCTFGEDGSAVSIIKFKDGEAGVVTESGRVHTSSTILLSMGANTGSVLDLQNQQSATGLFVTHIQLSDSEYEIYKNIPVLFDAEMGYFFPPDPTTKILKICTSGGGIKRTIKDPFDANSKISLPRYRTHNPTDTIPRNRIPNIKALLKKYVPELQNHKLFGSKICWIGDKEKSHFLIDRVPDYANLFVATGDSGHAYKFFPNIGKYIVQAMNYELDPEIAEAWKWESKKGKEMYDPSKANWRVSKFKTQDIEDIDFIDELEKAKL